MIAWIRLHVGEYQHGYEEGLVAQGVDDLVVQRHGGVPGLAHRGVLPRRPVCGHEVPYAPVQQVLAALDLQAEAAHTGEPGSQVQLARAAVPLPFVVDEAGKVTAPELVKDAGLGPAHGVVPPVGREHFGEGLHGVVSLRLMRIGGWG